MSTSSQTAKPVNRRVASLEDRASLIRQVSGPPKNIVSRFDGYTFALRAAYLSHLLQPKARRLQHAPAQSQRPPLQRHSTSVADLIKDFSHLRDSKSTRFPKEFMTELDKRITGVIMGKEKLPEYNDQLVKRTFGVFLNELKKPEFRKSMEKDRRVEDLLLIFFSNATKQLSQGKTPEDDQWKLMVDRHVALFVRLISSTLKANDWTRDRPELNSRLQSLEKKLLVHDQDLSADSQRNGGAGGSTTEVEIPRSQLVKDMPLVLTVANIFNKSLPQVQADLDEQKDKWTEKAALQDLKMYQTNLSLSNRQTLSPDDFESENAFESWKKGEVSDLAQMMLAIVQSNMELAKSTPGGLPQLKPANGMDYSDPSRAVESPSSYVIDQPVDLSSLTLNGGFSMEAPVDDREPYMFIPPDARAYYRVVLQEAISYDLRDKTLSPTNGEESESVKLLSKKSADLLNELGIRWRLPHVSRLTLFLDVMHEKFLDRGVDLDTLDATFSYVMEPQPDKRKVDGSDHAERSTWPVQDLKLHQQVLTKIHETLLRDLFEEFQSCYGIKPPNIGPIMTVLETRIYEDSLFPGDVDELDKFGDQLSSSLREKALEAYDEIFNRQVRAAGDRVEFYHVMQLSKGVLKLVERIRKRYRKTPQIMGVEPFTVLVETILPSFVSDARDQISSVLHDVQLRREEIPVQDGFDLYKEMVEMRQIHAEVLPDAEFPFHIEGLLATFVWRWIASLDENILSWVEGAVKHDNFAVRNTQPGHIPTDDERHSVSVADIFNSFKQSIDQIKALNWADDLQYAKFMTALSKAVSNGLSKYCDLLDQQFNREMDRPTPEQEAAMKQTRQEKWMQFAKDAIQQKEKIEPFQFLPESFVKLNNIEHAMLQLDKLEKVVDVDACAEIVRRMEPPPPPRQRRTEKFVFTIKIIEAEDLKPCDINGLSDPYVVLGDEHQKRLAKTRIIYGSLSPRWDESVDIVTQGLLNVVATIWDYDMMGDHDYVGRASIKLDPSHFRDFMPREYWLDLDTQGRLLVRVSMEGEKDDIQFYFGKTFRHLKRTENDMTRKITDKLSSYIHHCLSQRALRNLTSKGISISSVSSYFQRNRPQQTPQGPTQGDVENALAPLFTYFNENFAIMQQTLTSDSMVKVMSRLWKEVLATIESLLVPPLSDKLSQQRQLNEQELDVVFKWLQLLFDFFHAADEDTGVANGVPLDILKSTKYHDLQNLNFFYYETTENLIRTSERMAVANADRQKDAQARTNRLSAPPGIPAGPSFGGAAGLMGVPSTRKSKSIMLSRNLGTMKKAKAEKRKEAQAEPSDDMILRILRMRPEAQRYLRDRSRQKERLAAAAAAEMIVRQSLAAANREQAKTQRY